MESMDGGLDQRLLAGREDGADGIGDEGAVEGEGGCSGGGRS